MNLKQLVKSLLPPLIITGLRPLFRRSRAEPIRFIGNYKSWEEAEAASSGYGTAEILEKTRAAALKVKRGEAAFERDSVAFDAVHHDFPLLAGLLRAAIGHDRLSVLDFGGALGSTYFQCRPFLSVVNHLRWSVVDQPGHVACGRNEFANDQLHFYGSLDECLAMEKPNVLLLRSVLQYLPQPYRFLAEIVERDIPYLIIERTAFTRTGRDRLTVQQVPPWIYNASYPAWFLSEPDFRQSFAPRYRLVCEYESGEKFHPPGESAIYKSFQFQLET